MGLGIPTGVATIIAAGKLKNFDIQPKWNKNHVLAVSIHTSRGFDGHHNSFCSLTTHHFRFLGPSISLPVLLLWTTVCCFLTAVIIQCSRTLHLLHSKEDLFAVAAAELTLAMATLLLVVLHFRIDYKYDPDWCLLPADTAGISVIGEGGAGGLGGGQARQQGKVAWMV